MAAGPCALSKKWFGLARDPSYPLSSPISCPPSMFLTYPDRYTIAPVSMSTLSCQSPGCSCVYEYIYHTLLCFTLKTARAFTRAIRYRCCPVLLLPVLHCLSLLCTVPPCLALYCPCLALHCPSMPCLILSFPALPSSVLPCTVPPAVL